MAFKQLSDKDIKNMIGQETNPDNHMPDSRIIDNCAMDLKNANAEADTKADLDEKELRREVRKSLKLSKLIPKSPEPVPHKIFLDLHNKTQDEAWDSINAVLKSGARRAVIITGASGILKIKFQEWSKESLISPYISSVKPLNNGSFEILIKK